MARWTKAAAIPLASAVGTLLVAAGQERLDLTAATLHVYLSEDGGMIEVTVDNARSRSAAPDETARLQTLQAGLATVAARFATGEFATPDLVQGDNVPGTAALKRVRDRIEFAYAETLDGGVVRIRTKFARARSAIHEFLRYLIVVHKTGDALEITRPPD
jgi:hypothetical protein